MTEQRLTHFDDQGRPRMVDVTDKPETDRTAVAETFVTMRPETVALIRERRIAKGDVLTVAQIAGMMAAKQTSQWIPLCHSLPLSGVALEIEESGADRLRIRATVRTTARTGVEMEALVAVSAAALTVYDMCKSVDRAITIGPTRLLAKTGGKSGPWFADGFEPKEARGKPGCGGESVC